MAYLIGFAASWFIGEWIIGGLLFAIFGHGTSGPDKGTEKVFTWIGRVIAFLISIIIIKSMD